MAGGSLDNDSKIPIFSIGASGHHGVTASIVGSSTCVKERLGFRFSGKQAALRLGYVFSERPSYLAFGAPVGLYVYTKLSPPERISAPATLFGVGGLIRALNPRP